MVGPHDGQGWPKVPPSIAWWNGQTRGLAGRRIGTPAHVIGAQPGLVAPEDHAPRPPRLRHDRRILMAQPVPSCAGVLLIRPPQRLLRGEAPACQVLAGAVHCQAYARPNFPTIAL